MAMNAGTAYVEVLPEMTGFATGVGKGLNRIGNQVTRSSRVLTRGITIPVAAAGAASIKMALDFETSLQRVGSLTEASQGQVKAWGDQILELGPKLGEAPNDFAQALYFVASSGAKVADVMPITTAAVKASAAGMGDAQTVAQILTSAVNAYGAENLSAANAADVLTEAIKVGKAEPEALASSLGRVIPLAQTMGVTFAETAASVSTLTNTGLSAAEATTAIRAVLTTLVKPAQQTTDQYKKMGISVDYLRNSIKEHGLNETLVDLKNRIGDNKDALGKLFPNVRALTGFLALTGKNAAQVARNVDLVTHSTGAANKAFKTAAQSDAFKFRQALANLEAQAVKLGATLLPFATELLRDLVALVHAFDGLSSSQQHFIEIALGVLAIIGPIGTVFGNLIIITGAVVRGLSLVGTAMVTLAGASNAAAVSNQLVTSSFLEMDAAALPMISALGLVAVGLTAIVGIGIIGFLAVTTDAWGNFSDAEHEAADATNELAGALDALKTGHLDLRQATLDRKRAADQLAKDEKAQAAFTEKHGHANHALALQIEQDSIDVARAKGRQSIAEKDLADAQEKRQKALKDIIKAEQHAGTSASRAAAGVRGSKLAADQATGAYKGMSKAEILVAEKARRFVAEMGKQNAKLVEGKGRLKGAALQTAELNQAAQDLTIRLGHVPTAKQIKLYFEKNPDILAAEVAALKGQIDALHDRDIYIRVHQSQSGAGIGGGRAAGGPVSAGVPYLVGERGPELFVPQNSGNIVPNHRLAGGGVKHRIVIENWEEGTGYMESIADGSVGRNSNLNRQKRRMNR